MRVPLGFRANSKGRDIGTVSGVCFFRNELAVAVYPLNTGNGIFDQSIMSPLAFIVNLRRTRPPEYVIIGRSVPETYITAGVDRLRTSEYGGKVVI